MQLSLISVILALSVSAFAQIDVDDPVKQDAEGNIIPAALVPRSQYLEFAKRQIDESIPVKTDTEGNVVAIIPNNNNKRSAEPVIFIPEPGCALHEPVRTDSFGNIVKA